MSAHPPKIRRPWEPSDKTAVTSRLVPCPRPAGSAAKGRRLSHLVTKFETLGAVSSFDGTSALETQAPIPVKVVASHGNGGQESLTMSPSLSWVAASIGAASIDTSPSKHVPPAWGSTSPVKSSASATRPKSMVAERRKLFETSSAHDSSGARPRGIYISFLSRCVVTADGVS